MVASAPPVWLFMLASWVVGMLTGALALVGIRWLRRLGSTLVINLNPHTKQYRESYQRPVAGSWRAGSKEVPKDAPVTLGEIYRRSGGGPSLTILDAHAGVPVTVDTAGSLLVHPDGARLRQVARSKAYHAINEEEKGMNVAAILLIILLGIVVLGGMLIYVVTQMQGGAAG